MEKSAVQYLANEFWSRWKREYIQSLQIRQKWNKPHRNLKIDDIVLIIDHNVPRNHWKLGRVTETMPDKNGCVRIVKLLVSDENLDNKGKCVKLANYIERPVHNVVLLVEGKDRDVPVGEPNV